MYENLKKSLDELFENAPKTNRANELKEELLANLIDKYNDLISSGKKEDEAFKTSISSIGDVDELIDGLKTNNVLDNNLIQKKREKSALLLSISIGMYIMSVVVLILTNSISIMLTIVAAATCIIVYNIASRPKYIKSDDTLVEEFKEWKVLNDNKNEIIKSIKSIIWLITVAIYFILSFMFDAWTYSWIIFIIGAAIEKIISLNFNPNYS